MDLNETMINFNKLINLFEYKIKENKKIENKITIINNNLINTLNNNEIIFKNKIITDKEYNTNLNNLESLNKKLIDIKINNKISNTYYYDINLKINNLFKEFTSINENLSSRKIIDILNIFDINWKNNIDNDNLDIILFYNNIFNCIKIKLENNSDKKNKFIDIIKNKFNKNKSIIKDIYGANIKICFNKTIININGYFINDNFNIIKNDKIFKKKKYCY